MTLGIESKTDGRFDDAFSDFEKAAAEGDAAGQCMLGLAYETGEGVAQSWPDAVLLYRAAAGQGHAQAQCNLGWCYEFGKGVPQDAKAAARWYGEAALQHDPRAECCLAICYTNGTGVAADPVRAAQLYTLSAQAGFVPAMRNLAQDDPFRTRHRQKRRSCPGLVPKGRCPGRRPCPVYVRPVL